MESSHHANPNFSRLPVLDGSNYAYWMTRMRTYLKSIDVGVWEACEKHYVHPYTTDSAGDKIPNKELTPEEAKAATFNEKALNSIFAWIDMHKFRLVQNASSAKEAWDILQSHCEGDSSVNVTDHIFFIFYLFSNYLINYLDNLIIG